MFQQVKERIEKASEEVIRLQRALTALPALGPENGGIGEEKKAAFIMQELHALGVSDTRLYKAPDERVPCGYRPNIVARVAGKSERTLWILGHMDVVPAGDESLWQGDPWQLRVEGDILIGRGVEDNQQAIVSALVLLQALQKSETKAELSVGCIFVADEETGNTHGVEWLMREHGELFSAEDMFLVPDFGCADGSEIEIAEKHTYWLRFTTEGKQCHGSTPQRGKNAMLIGSALALAMQNMHDYFPQQDALFDPPMSTFTPTKREANVPNVNTVPGRDVFYMDCRILPCYSLEQVYAKAEALCQAVASRYGVQVSVDVESAQQAPEPTSAQSAVVLLLQEALQGQGVESKLIGIGGGTVAKELRKKGFQAAVWSKILSNCHEPEEKACISNALFDAQIFAHMIFSKNFS